MAVNYCGKKIITLGPGNYDAIWQQKLAAALLLPKCHPKNYSYNSTDSACIAFLISITTNRSCQVIQGAKANTANGLASNNLH